MSELFALMRDFSTARKAVIILAYGLASFLVTYLAGVLVLDNVVFFRFFELLWFVHIIIICLQITRDQRELFLLAALALLPGIANNLVGLTSS